MKFGGQELKIGKHKWYSKSLKQRYQFLDLASLAILIAWIVYVLKVPEKFAISLIGVIIIVIFQMLCSKIKKTDKAMRKRAGK